MSEERKHDTEVLVEEDRQCPACGGPMQLLGMLGCMMHFRCRNCGCPDHDEGGCG